MGLVFWRAIVYNKGVAVETQTRRAGKERAAMKTVLKALYIALIGLVVFMGALYIAEGARESPDEGKAEIHRSLPLGPVTVL